VITMPPIEADALRLRDEFLSMPGLSLTPAQAARLLSLRVAHAAMLLDDLRREGFLVVTPEGLFRRAPIGHASSSSYREGDFI